MSGPAPTPTAIRRATGNPGHRALNTQEPKPAAGVPTAPKHLTKLAKVEWKRVARHLAALGVLTHSDRGILAIYAQAWGRMAEAEEELAKSGTIIKSPSGYPIQNPWLAVAIKAAEQVNRFAQQLGLTPSSRSRIRVDSAADDADEGLGVPA
jgi:P27 family predicted phage terminase small subunit